MKHTFPVFLMRSTTSPGHLVRTLVVEPHGLLDLVGRAQPEQAAGLADASISTMWRKVPSMSSVARLQVRIGQRRADDGPVVLVALRRRQPTPQPLDFIVQSMRLNQSPEL